jgi:hypothetical protein
LFAEQLEGSDPRPVAREHRLDRLHRRHAVMDAMPGRQPRQPKARHDDDLVTCEAFIVDGEDAHADHDAFDPR